MPSIRSVSPPRQHTVRLIRLLVVIGLLLLLSLTGALLHMGYRSERATLLASARERLTERALAMDSRMGEVAYQIASMRRWAEEALNGPAVLPPHPLLGELRDVPGSGAYGLEDVPGHLARSLAGNVFGLGSVRDIPPHLWREINLALWMFPQHQAALATAEELSWIYYDSYSRMYAISPWVSHAEMLRQTGAAGMPELIEYARTLDFLQLGLPERNPLRLPYWTPLYTDPAGKGLMITHAAPVYEGDVPRGVVGADLSLGFLNYYVRAAGALGGRYYVVGTAPEQKAGQMVMGQAGMVAAATGLRLSPEDGPGDFDAVARPVGWSWADVATLQAGSVGHLGQDYVIAVPLSKAPWLMLYVLPEAEAEAAALLALRPAMLLAAVLLLALFAVLAGFHRLQRRVESIAATDELTGTLNRREFLAGLQREWARHRRHGRPLSLLIVDLDHLKKINDTHGPAGGDQVLRDVAQVASSCLRAGDLIGRLGGEEFAVALQDTSAARGEQVAERLRAAVASHSSRVSGMEIRATASIGLAWARSEDRDWSELMLRASQAVQAAKRRGRNRVARYDPAAMPPLTAAPLTEWKR